MTGSDIAALLRERSDQWASIGRARPQPGPSLVNAHISHRGNQRRCSFVELVNHVGIDVLVEAAFFQG